MAQWKRTVEKVELEMSKFAEKIKKIIMQFVKFGIVGLSNTLISLVAYYLLVYLGCHYIIANTVGFILSVVNAFYWNNKYVFLNRQEKNLKKAFVKVFVSYGGSFLLSTVLITVFVEILHISEWLAPILRLVVTVPINFVMNKLWAFRDKTDGEG